MATTARSVTSTGTRLVPHGGGDVGIEVLATRAGVHPAMVRQLIALGLIAPSGGTRAAPLFRGQDAVAVARALRLRRDLGLNYAGAILACDLLARIDELEARLRVAAPPPRQREVMRWTRTG
jgi:DNA-binding transcriptional MerR regulator